MSRFFQLHTNTLRTTKSVDVKIPEDFIQALDKIQVCRIVLILFCHGMDILSSLPGLIDSPLQQVR